jgi:hypothetical protein
MNEETVTLILIISGFFVVFPLFWSTDSAFLLSRIGGWGSMAEAYPYREPLIVQCFSHAKCHFKIGHVQLQRRAQNLRR